MLKYRKINENSNNTQIAYHATNSDFNEFDSSFIKRFDYGKGFYFTVNKAYAENYGKYLLTCEIPEDKYFLDLDIAWDNDNNYIQEALVELWSSIKNVEDKLKLEEVMFRDYCNTGWWIYNALTEIYDTTEQVQDLLYKYGIKGLYSFDGDCYIVFKKEDIKILNRQRMKESYKNKINEMSLKQQIDYFETKDNSYNNKLINFGKPSNLLQNLGVPNKDIFMSVGKYKCSTGQLTLKGHSHCVSKETMIDLPKYLSDPKYILYPKNSKFQSRRYVLVLDVTDNNGCDIVAIIDYDWQGNRITVLNSVYGKDNIQNFINNSTVIYKKANKSASQGSNSQKESFINLNNIINQNLNNLNPYNKKSLQNEKLEKAEIQYGYSTIDTIISFDPSNYELQGLLNKYKALRVLVAQEPGSGKLQLICMPAASGDHGLLATWLIKQGYKIFRNSFYHIVNSEKGPFLTLDSFYKNSEDLKYELLDELNSIYDNQELINKMLDEYYMLKELLPSIVNTEAIDYAVGEFE